MERQQKQGRTIRGTRETIETGKEDNIRIERRKRKMIMEGGKDRKKGKEKMEGEKKRRHWTEGR